MQAKQYKQGLGIPSIDQKSSRKRSLEPINKDLQCNFK